MAGGSASSGFNPQTAQWMQRAMSAQAPQFPGRPPLPYQSEQMVPPFAQGPPNASSYATPQYPQLFGGQWNQLSQQMAGPQYQFTPPQRSAPGAPVPGTPAAAPGGVTPGSQYPSNPYWNPYAGGGGMANTQPIRGGFR